MNDFELVKEKYDLLEVAKEYTHMKKAGKEYVGLCPIHDEKTPSFYVSKQKQQFYCMGCQAGGDVIELVRLIENTDPFTALEMLADKKNIPLSSTDNEGYQKRKDFQRKQSALVDKANRNVKGAIDYLLGRGINQDAVNRFKIGYGEKHHSIIIPLVDHRNLPIGYAERFISEPPAGFKGKYRLPSEQENELFKKSEFLFNEYNARMALKKDVYLLIFEGQLDAISADQIGFQASIACMQSSLTSDQAKRVIKLAEDNTVIVLVPDKNKSGMVSVRQNTELLRALNPKIPIKVMNLPEKHHENGKEYDMNDFVKEGLIRETAESYIDYVEVALIDLMMLQTKDFQLQQEHARDIASEVDNPFIRERISKYLADKWQVETNKVDQLLKVKRSASLYEHFKDIDQMYDAFMDKIVNVDENNITLGYESIDKVLNSGMGIPTGWVVDFMARSSVGKTAFALNVINNAVEKHDVGSIFFSFEQQDSDIYPKLASIRLNQSQKKVYYEYGHFNNEQYHQDVRKRFKNKLLIFDNQRLNLQQIEELIHAADEKYFDEVPCRVVLIDYLGYIKANGITDKYESISELTAELKQVAKRTKKVFIVLVQTSRKGGDGSEPVSFESARDSGTIEENADILLGAYRPELSKELGSQELIEVLDDYMVQVLKNRNGASGITVRLKFDKPQQIIREWSEREKQRFMGGKVEEMKGFGSEEERILWLRGAL